MSSVKIVVGCQEDPQHTFDIQLSILHGHCSLESIYQQP